MSTLVWFFIHGGLEDIQFKFILLYNKYNSAVLLFRTSLGLLSVPWYRYAASGGAHRHAMQRVGKLAWVFDGERAPPLGVIEA